MKSGLQLGLVLLLALFSVNVLAQKSPLDDRLIRVMSSSAETDKALINAKKVTFFCANCHGDDGNSAQNDVPNLAGQNPHYLLTQIDKFVHGQRQNQFMQGLMKMLSEEDRINATVFYSSKDVKISQKATSSAGRELYLSHCVMCHGAEGRGGDQIPRLAGQQSRYLVLSVTRYRNKTGERIYEPMSAITAGLKDAEILALATYLSSLN